MLHRLLGLAHAAAVSAVAAAVSAVAAAVSAACVLRPQRGQGTVEYVALILLLALVFAAVVKFGAGKDFDIGRTIVTKLKEAIDGVGEAPRR